ncbi:hypothetical protein ACJX0J_034941, partial [Zea mays]
MDSFFGENVFISSNLGKIFESSKIVSQHEKMMSLGVQPLGKIPIVLVYIFNFVYHSDTCHFVSIGINSVQLAEEDRVANVERHLAAGNKKKLAVQVHLLPGVIICWIY